MRSFLLHWRRAISVVMAGLFLLSSVGAPAYAQGVMTLPGYGVTSSAATGFIPVSLKAIQVRPNEPLVFDFVIDMGSATLSQEDLKAETEKLAKYFLATVTLPEKELWVNLSPYEQDRIIPDGLGVTEMGRIMLAQDKVLKELSSSIIHPDSELGKTFWARIYAKTQEVLGSTDIPVETFNKVWIVPQSANVYEMENTALLGTTTLKVMMDEDVQATAINKEAGTTENDATRSASIEAFRSIILPEIEKEVNTGKDFAPLRQVYGAMVLATWYKKALKDGLLGQVYADQSKTRGVETLDKNAKQNIYDAYVDAFKQGAFNFIHEDTDAVTGQMTPRQYFSGGEKFADNLESSMHVVTVVGKDIPADEVRASHPIVATIALGKPKNNVVGVKDFEVATGVSYFKGEIKTTPITRPFRASEKSDVKDITELNEQDGMSLEKSGAVSVARGEGAFYVLAAGAASRMAVSLAPESVKAQAGGEEILSKAGVPVGKIDGKVVNYLDVFGNNVARFLGEIDQEARNQGAASDANKNVVGIFTNDEYRPEHDRILARSQDYGLKNGQVHLFHQPLGPKYVGTPADVRKLESKFASPEAFQRALALAEDVQAKIVSGDPDALKSVVLENERDPQGHGEFFHQLIVSGEFLDLLQQGKKWMAVKNIDNIAAKFDRTWLRTLGLFLSGKIDAQPEVSPRAPGQKGGSLIVMEDNGSDQLAEDPSLNATKDAQGNVKVSLTQSFWFNDAVALFSLEYVISIYKKDGQTLEDFVAELRAADQLKREEIADRGRQKFPKLLDPKPAKKQDAVAVKIETNMWQSTGIVPQAIAVKAVGVRGARNFPITAYPAMTREQQIAELAKLRFLGTKQWNLSDVEMIKARTDFEKAMGRPVTDVELSLTLETYDGNKILTDDLLDYIWNQELVAPGIFNGIDKKDLVKDAAAVTAVDKITAFKTKMRLDPRYAGSDQMSDDPKEAESLRNRLNRLHGSDSKENAHRETLIAAHWKGQDPLELGFLVDIEDGTGVFSMIKPDAIENNFQDKIILDLIEEGFTVKRGNPVQLTPEQVDAFYEMHVGKPWYPKFRAGMTAGPVIPLFLTVKEITKEEEAATFPKKFPGTASDFAEGLNLNDPTSRAEMADLVKADKVRIGFLPQGVMKKASFSWFSLVMDEEIAKLDLDIEMIPFQGPEQMTLKEAEKFFEDHRARTIKEYEYFPDMTKAVSSGELSWFILKAGASGFPSKMAMQELKKRIRIRYSEWLHNTSEVEHLDIDDAPHISDSIVGDANAVNKDWANLLQMHDARQDQKVDNSAIRREGGINFDAALLDMQITRTGTGVKVTVDPALIERIKTEGVDGFSPVVINMMPVTGVLAAVTGK